MHSSIVNMIKYFGISNKTEAYNLEAYKSVSMLGFIRARD